MPASSQTIYDAYPEAGWRYRLVTETESALDPVYDDPGYWRLAPRLYRRLLPTETDRYRAPLDPFKIVAVDPDRIQRFTRRIHPTWFRKWWLFGRVHGGNWDTDRDLRLIDDYGRDPEAYFDAYAADRFEETGLYRSLDRHFREGVPWEETELVREALRLSDPDGGDHPWAPTREAVWRKCERIDALKERMEKLGCRTQRELIQMGYQDNHGFLMARAHEIQVDVARDGELLFVDGRHRLAIAKILGLNSVLVVFLLRHPEWMERRDAAYAGGDASDHPDMVEFRDDSEASLAACWYR